MSSNGRISSAGRISSRRKCCSVLLWMLWSLLCTVECRVYMYSRIQYSLREDKYKAIKSPNRKFIWHVGQQSLPWAYRHTVLDTLDTLDILDIQERVEMLDMLEYTYICTCIVRYFHTRHTYILSYWTFLLTLYSIIHTYIILYIFTHWHTRHIHRQSYILACLHTFILIYLQTYSHNIWMNLLCLFNLAEWKENNQGSDTYMWWMLL